MKSLNTFCQNASKRGVEVKIGMGEEFISKKGVHVFDPTLDELREALDAAHDEGYSTIWVHYAGRSK